MQPFHTTALFKGLPCSVTPSETMGSNDTYTTKGQQKYYQYPITFITVGIDRTGSHCKIFIQFRCYTDRCIISFEVVLLGSLRHTTLIQIPQSYIYNWSCRFYHLPINYGSGRSPVPDHSFSRIIESISIFIFSVIIPVTAIYYRIIPFYLSSILFRHSMAFSNFRG